MISVNERNRVRAESFQELGTYSVILILQRLSIPRFRFSR